MAANASRRRTRGRIRSRFNVVLAASVCLTGTMLPLAVVAATASPASAATTGVPRCPPDCGAVAAGDPLLVPFMTANPGVDWQAFPAADSQSYVNSLRRNVRRLAGTVGEHERRCGAMGVGESSVQLADHACVFELAGEGPPPEADRRRRRHLLLGGRHPSGSPTPIPGIPGSVSGSCAFGRESAVKGASVAAFIRGNVAVLIEINSRSSTPLAALTTCAPCAPAIRGSPIGGSPDFER